MESLNITKQESTINYPYYFQGYKNTVTDKDLKMYVA